MATKTILAKGVPVGGVYWHKGSDTFKWIRLEKRPANWRSTHTHNKRDRIWCKAAPGNPDGRRFSWTRKDCLVEVDPSQLALRNLITRVEEP